MLPLPLAHEAYLASVIDWLGRTIAAHIARDRMAGPLILLAWTTVRRRANRLAALMVRFRAGRLTPPRTRGPSEAGRADPVGPETPPLRLPRGKGWMGKLMPDTRVYADQLRHMVLTDTEMQALIAVSPQARRLLRSLIGMLTPDPPPAVLAMEIAEPKVSSESGAETRRRVPAAAPVPARSRVGRLWRRVARRDGAGRFSPA